MPGTKQQALSGWSEGARIILPKNMKRRLRRICDAALCLAFARTVALETLDMNAGLMPKTLRKHRFWNPSKRLSSAAVRQQLAIAYNSFDSTKAVYMRNKVIIVVCMFWVPDVSKWLWGGQGVKTVLFLCQAEP